MAKLKTIASFLDRELKVAEFEDGSNNGVQVANSGTVRTVCCGVDASLEFFEEAARRGADMVVCHHGLSWGDSLKRITGRNYRLLSFLVHHDMALYGAHIPLDAHPRYGNNILIARALGLQKRKRFGEHRGRLIGFEGTLPSSMRLETFKRRVGRVLSPAIRTMDFGPKTVRRAAVVSGGAPAQELEEAAEKGIDVYVSGEPSLAVYNAAKECGMNAVFAGHYATEVFGVRALAGLLKKRFKVKAEFVDMGTPY